MCSLTVSIRRVRRQRKAQEREERAHHGGHKISKYVAAATIVGDDCANTTAFLLRSDFQVSRTNHLERTKKDEQHLLLLPRSR
jgi:hypothetical protein